MNAKTEKTPLQRLEISRAEAELLAYDFSLMAKDPVDRAQMFRDIEAGTMKFMDVPLAIVPTAPAVME